MKRFFSLFLVIVLLLAAVPTFYVSAADKATFTVGKVTGAPGEEVDVNVSITSNPGLTSVQVLVAYDTSVLEVKKITGLSFKGTKTAVGPTTANPLSIIWCDALKDVTATGDIATITFKIKDDAADGIYTLAATSDQANVFDTKFNDVPFTTVNGYVDIKNPNPTKQPATSSQTSESVQNDVSSAEDSIGNQTNQSTPAQSSSESEEQAQDNMYAQIIEGLLNSAQNTQTDNADKNSDTSLENDDVITDGAIISQDNSDSTDVDNTDNNGWLIWVVVAAIVILGGAFAVVIIKSKKQ